MTAQPAWLAQRERGSRPLIWLIVKLTLLLGRGVGRVLLYPICTYFLLFSGLARRAFAAQVPGLDRLDLDLSALRFQLAHSARARGMGHLWNVHRVRETDRAGSSGAASGHSPLLRVRNPDARPRTLP